MAAIFLSNSFDSILVSNFDVSCNCLFTTLSTIVSSEENNYNLILIIQFFKGYFSYNRLVILSQTS